MNDSAEEDKAAPQLSERVLDALVFLPTGVVMTVVEELPHFAARGRERFGVQINSARSVGRVVVHMGGRELKRRSPIRRESPAPGAAGPCDGSDPGAGTRLRSIPRSRPESSEPPATADDGWVAARTGPVSNAHIPDVGELAIPGFDTLSASHVVQRLDGLTRTELVAVRAYESATRGRRTILTRVDQLLDERS